MKIQKNIRFLAPVLSILILPSSCPRLCAGAEEANPCIVPEDFEIEAVYGGMAPWTNRGALSIKAGGKARSRKYKSDGSMIFLDEAFQIGPSEMAALYCAVLQSGVLMLDKKYDGNVLDGTFCSLRFKGGGRSAQVETSNIVVTLFDNLCRAVNAIIPEKYSIFYNQITYTETTFILRTEFLDKDLPPDAKKDLHRVFSESVQRNLENADLQASSRDGEFRIEGLQRGSERERAAIMSLLSPARIRFLLAAPAELQAKHLRKPDGEAGGTPMPGMPARSGLVPLPPPEGYAWMTGPGDSYILVASRDPGFDEGIVEQAVPPDRPKALAVVIRKERLEAFGAWIGAKPGHRLALALDGGIIALSGPEQAAPDRIEFDEPSWSSEGVLRLTDAFKSGRVAPGLYREVNGAWGYWPDLGLFVRDFAMSGFPPLTLADAKELGGKVAGALNPHPPLWFAEIRKGSVKVYCEPAMGGGRIRSGRAVRFEKEAGKAAAVSRWFQVLGKDAKGFNRLPSGLDLPFEASGAIAESDLAEIVDFLRSGPVKTSGEGKDAFTVKFSADNPVLSVGMEGDLVAVRCGIEFGPDMGAGQIVKLRKTKGGFEAADVQWWWK